MRKEVLIKNLEVIVNSNLYDKMTIYRCLMAFMNACSVKTDKVILADLRRLIDKIQKEDMRIEEFERKLARIRSVMHD